MVVARWRPPVNKKDWYLEYSMELKLGAECCSTDSLSFHYVNEKLMKRLYHLMYSCPKGPSMLATK